MKTSVRALFKKAQKDDKKTVLQFELKGDVTETQMMNLMSAAGNIVDIQVLTPQIDLDDVHDNKREGKPVVPEGQQLTLEDAAAASEGNSYVVVDEHGNETVESGDPSEDEKEIESREKEVYQEEREAEQAPDDVDAALDGKKDDELLEVE